MVYFIHTYKEGTALSKESKIAKKEQKAAKKAAKLEKKQAKDYAKLVAVINKKNAKAEKKANKKGKPFVPTPIPTEEEAFAAVASQSKGKKIATLIILLLIIWVLVYFLVMWFTYVAPTKAVEQPDEEPPAVAAEYDRYENTHEITTTKIYSVSEAKAVLKQVIHDNWKSLGYSSDPSSASINQNGSATVNGVDCYTFTASGKSYAVARNLSAVYQKDGNGYKPATFHDTDLLEY